MIALQPLSQALQQGREIYAVIRGSAVNHDGLSNGLTAPNVDSQIALIRSALDTAGLSPDQIDYVEAHGTGTPLGDPTEVRALAQVFPSAAPRALGGVKANAGHLEPAAGIGSSARRRNQLGYDARRSPERRIGAAAARLAARAEARAAA